MGLDFAQLKKVSDDLKAGNSLTFRQQDFTPNQEEVIRLLEPHDNMGKMYFMQAKVYWIDKKPYLSLDTFGEDCPIDEEVKEAKESGDKDLIGLLKSDKFDVKIIYLMAAIRLSIAIQGDKEEVSVIGNKPVLFECGSGIFGKIHNIVAHTSYIRQAARKNSKGELDSWSVLDRQKGVNFMCTKTGSGLKTEYTALPDASPMDLTDAAFDKLYENVPSPKTYLESLRKSPEYLRGVIRNYLYGEEMPEDDSKQDQVETEKEEKPKTGKATTGKAEGKSSSLLGDLTELEDE